MAFGDTQLNMVGQQFNMLKELWDMNLQFDPDVTSGLFGEEARLKRGIGTGIAASGDVSGTANKLPLFNVSSDFAGRRMQARNMAEQARMLRLLGITQSMTAPISSFNQVDALRLQKSEQESFDISNFVPSVNFAVPL